VIYSHFALSIRPILIVTDTLSHEILTTIFSCDNWQGQSDPLKDEKTFILKGFKESVGGTGPLFDNVDFFQHSKHMP